jgi:hypothetical protein
LLSISVLIGVQLEKSNIATSFDVRPWNTELVPLGAVSNGITANRNRISNGNFQLDSIYHGNLISPISTLTWLSDNWQIFTSNVDATSLQAQKNLNGTTPPIVTFLGVSSNASLSSTQSVYISQRINWSALVDLSWGTPNAQSLILSFQVRVRFPGLYGGSFRKGMSNIQRSFPFTFTVGAADTWTPVTVLIPGDQSMSYAQIDLTVAAASLVFCLHRGSAFPKPIYSASNTWVDGDSHTTIGQTNFAQQPDGYYHIAAVQLFSASAAFDYHISFDAPQLNSVNSAALSYLADSTPAFKNRLQNGAMLLDTANSKALVTANNGVYISDYWMCSLSIGGTGILNKLQSQINMDSVLPPNGFTNYVGIKTTGTTSLGIGDWAVVYQNIPYGAIQDFAFGTPDAVTITLSFWVRSNLAGAQLGGTFRQIAGLRTFPFFYTITSANEWQFVSVTIKGDTNLSGVWSQLNLSNMAASVLFSFGDGGYAGAVSGAKAFTWSDGGYHDMIGQINLFAAMGNYVFLTGVQLERGTIPTAFDTKSYYP